MILGGRPEWLPASRRGLLPLHQPRGLRQHYPYCQRGCGDLRLAQHLGSARQRLVGPRRLYGAKAPRSVGEPWLGMIESKTEF